MVLTSPQINLNPSAKYTVPLKNSPKNIHFGQTQDSVEFSSQKEEKNFLQEHPVVSSLIGLGVIAVTATVIHKMKTKPKTTSSTPKRTPQEKQAGFEKIAQRYFEKSVKLTHKDAVLDKKIFEKAQRAIDKAIKLNPKKGYYYCQKGVLFEIINETPKAIKEYEKAIEIDPKCPLGYFNLANSIKNENPQDAFDFLQIGLKLNPNDKDFRKLDYNLRAILGREEILTNKNPIIDSLNKAIAKEPKNYNLYTKRAIEREKINDFEGAFRDYEVLSKILPNEKKHAAYRNMAAVRGTKQNRMEEALEYCNKAIELKPDNATNYFIKSQILYNSTPKKTEEALEAINKAINLEKEAPHCYYIRAQIKQDLGKIDEAKADMGKFNELSQKK